VGVYREGKYTLKFTNLPVLAGTYTVAGPIEGQGPLGRYFDLVYEDSLLGENTWEKAEVRMLHEAVDGVLKGRNLRASDIDYLIGGDLLNQITASSFAARDLDIPFLGLYSACATFSEALIVSAMMVASGASNRVVAGVSSHHDTAERQFRFPTEFANQRPMTATWTVTGSGACLIEKEEEANKNLPRLSSATLGRVVDAGIKDAYDMGSAMAPAAADTIKRHLEDTRQVPEAYDLIITGDLSRVGKPLVEDLLSQEGIEVMRVLNDCGIIIYDPKQDVHAGGSGAACSALVTGGYLYKELLNGNWNRILLVATGALLSPTTIQQGESIPGIAHAIAIER